MWTLHHWSPYNPSGLANTWRWNQDATRCSSFIEAFLWVFPRSDQSSSPPPQSPTSSMSTTQSDCESDTGASIATSSTIFQFSNSNPNNASESKEELVMSPPLMRNEKEEVEDGLCKVDQVLAKKLVNRKAFYLVKWFGHPHSSNTW